jgi:hypothetical protein
MNVRLITCAVALVLAGIPVTATWADDVPTPQTPEGSQKPRTKFNR